MTKKPSYRDFYEARGRQAMWLTANVAYRLGAVLAVPAARLGASPNLVSMASLGAALGGAGFAVALGYGNGWAALLLFLAGQLAYGLDCADGVLARVTGRGSSFGMILDKGVDTVVGIAMPLILAIGALPLGLSRPETGILLGALALFLASRMGLVVPMWLREAVEKRERTAEDVRRRTPAYYLKQLVGNVVLDDVALRTFFALAWAFRLFWELIGVLAVLNAAMAVYYLLSVKREMDGADRNLKDDGAKG